MSPKHTEKSTTAPLPQNLAKSSGIRLKQLWEKMSTLSSKLPVFPTITLFTSQ